MQFFRIGLMAMLFLCTSYGHAETILYDDPACAAEEICTPEEGFVGPLNAYTMTASGVWADNPSGQEAMLGHDFSWSNYASDYNITFNYSNLFDNYCNASQSIEIRAYRDAFQGSDLVFNQFVSNATSGSFTVGFGPNVTETLYITIYYRGRSLIALGPATRGCSTEVDLNNPITIATSSIYRPTNVTAQRDVDDDRIKIDWSKGSDIPDFFTGYYIYRNGSRVGTVSGSSRSFTDTGLASGTTYTYGVSTFTNPFNQESGRVITTGSTFGLGLTATDGTKYGGTTLSWNDVKNLAEEIRIERSEISGANRQELAILSKNARGYTDTEGTPGLAYTYYMTPIGSVLAPDSDNGYSRPDGTVKGKVRSSVGAGVSGVEMKLTLQSTLPAGGQSPPGGCSGATYCTTTNAAGFYEFKDVYYHETAEFTIVPNKGGGSSIVHEFEPALEERTLTINNKNAVGVDFTDLTVFTAAGRVTYPTSPNNVTCGVKGVTIFVDDTNFGIKTDANGEWSYAIQDEGTYTFRPDFLHHDFENDVASPVTTIAMTGDRLDIDFTDVETDTLTVTVQGSCEVPLGDYAVVRITSPQGCYFADYQTNAQGILELTDLPARDYTVEVVDIIDNSGANPNLTNILDQIGNMPIDIDLTLRDTGEIITTTDQTTYIPEITQTLPNDSIIIIQAADTILAGTSDTVRADVKPSLKFIYRSPLDISIDYDQAGATTTMCQNSEGDDIVLMEQGFSYSINIQVQEVLGVDCYIDTGFLKIYDFVSDRGNQFVRVPIKNGIAQYRIDAGEPIINSSAVHNHEKLLYIIPEVDLVEPVPVESWILVTGAKTNTPSFISRTPEIPMLIVHDPPGDNSYAYVEKGTSVTNFTTTEVLVGGEAGAYANLLIGAKVLTPFSNNGLGTEIKFSAVAGRDNFNRTGTYTTLTFEETFSTSDADNLTGHGGDVYIGAAFNQEFADANVLTFDVANCSADVDVVPAISDQTFATTFVYTETHIRNTLLPTIGFIRENIQDGREFSTLSPEDQKEVNSLIADSVSWTNILAKNDTARGKDAVFEENISFSAGAPITRQYTADSIAEESYEYNVFINTDFAVGIKIDNESGAWFDSQIGVMGAFRYSTNTNTGSETDTTRTVGYVLDDNDIGDFFSVDIKKDKSYNVPAFDLKLGTTSCPQEEGSQARDRPTIQITPPEITNVPTDGTANFLCQVANLSESRETREYAVRVVSTTNPDGAQVRLGGQLINNGEASFFVPYGETVNLNLAVTKGPLASQYNDIAIMVYPPCEYELWQDNGNLVNADTAYIKVLNFQTNCTNISLRNPDDGWLINQTSGNMMRTTLSGYDLNNEDFNYVTIEIKKEGEGYTPAYRLNKGELIGGNYDVSLDLSPYPDGNYRIRASANCGPSGLTYSSEKKGIIDRNSLAPFGIPTPNDGFLRLGQEISVAFDKQIDCDFRNGYEPVIKLKRADTNEEIPVTASCFQNKLILNTTPHLTEMPDLQGVVVEAMVDSLMDLSGNIQKYATNWTFLVNVNPVFWDPDPIYASGVEGLSHIVTGVLKNNSLVSRSFTLDAAEAPSIVHVPEWLTPLQLNGTVLPSDDYAIGFQVDEELLPGVYQDSITALVDGRAITVPITFELLAKQINWVFHPGLFQHDMTVVAQFSLDGTDDLLSTDERDLVAAFVGGEIRGLAHVEYVEQTNSYVVFLKVHSNYESGPREEVTFRFWRALTGVEYGAVERLDFVTDENHGTVIAPLILHPEGIIQAIPLTQGWNWISLNVMTDDMSRENILRTLMLPRRDNNVGNNLIVKDQSQASTYLSGSGWNGNLTTFQLGQGYLLYLSDSPDTLKVVGLPSPTPVSTRIRRNWNWIGYPRLKPEPVNDVLSSLRLRNGDILKGQSDFALYDDGTNGWAGSMSQFMPGRGYKLHARFNGNLDHPAQKSNGYEVQRDLYEHNMLVTGEFDAQLIGEEYYEGLRVLAFINGECRGIGELEFCASAADHRAFILVSGNAADHGLPIEYRIINTITGKEYPTNGEVTNYAADRIEGTVPEPYPFFSPEGPSIGVGGNEFILGANQPNPASRSTVIPFALPVDQSVQIDVHDANGRLITTIDAGQFPAGKNTIVLDVSSFPAGIYIYSLRTELFSDSQRMIVR